MRICTATGCGQLNSDHEKTCRQCSRQLRNTIDVLDAGDVVGSYRIVRYIGHGGFGVVYEGVHTETGARVAIKETFDPASIRGFQREFEVLRQLRHENLPQYYEMFTTGENGYLVMEFVEGQSLAEILEQQKQPLLISQVEGFALQLGNAVRYLHAQRPPLLHRDIKPANVRLRPDGVIKLVDFGIMKEQRAADGTVTQISRRAFSPAFAPMEQATPDGWVTVASDIYSFSATLYQLMTNSYPMSSLDRGLSGHDPLPEPRRLNSAISPTLSNAIMKAMARKPEERFPSVEAFLQAMRGDSPLSTAPLVQPRLPMWVGVAVGALLVIVVVGLLLFAPDGISGAVVAPDSATVVPTETATPPTAATATAEPIATSTVANPLLVATSTRITSPTAAASETATASPTASPTTTHAAASATATTYVAPPTATHTPTATATWTASPTPSATPTYGAVVTLVVPPIIINPTLYVPTIAVPVVPNLPIDGG